MSEKVSTLSADVVKDILAPEPDTTLDVLQTEEERVVAVKILPALTAKANDAARLDYANKLQKAVDDLKASNQKLIEETLEQIRRDAKPLDPNEIQKTLSQEYLTLTVKVPKREKGKMKEIEFTLCEVPQAVETRFLDILQKKLMPYLKQLTSLDFKNATDMAGKLQTVIEALPGALDLMADMVVIALNPYKEDEYKFVTSQWAQDNLSSYRMFNIIMGQVAVSRIRDFFSAAFQGLPQ